MKKFSIVLISLLILLIYSYPAAASDKNIVDKNDTIKTLKALDDHMNKAGVAIDKEATTILGTEQVNIGTNKTFTWANAGNSGCPDSNWAPWGSYAHGFGYASSPGWADSGSNVNFIGTVGAWGWIGNQIYVAGSTGQTRQAKITFSGNYKGQLQTILPSTGGSATGKVRVSVFDISSEADLVGTTVFEKTIAGYEPVYQGPINHSTTLTLQAGRTYALRIGVSSSATCKAYNDVSVSQFADTDTWGAWQPNPGGFGVNYSSISIQWL